MKAYWQMTKIRSFAFGMSPSWFSWLDAQTITPRLRAHTAQFMTRRILKYGLLNTAVFPAVVGGDWLATGTPRFRVRSAGQPDLSSGRFPWFWWDG
jgi:hypothetical protein